MSKMKKPKTLRPPMPIVTATTTVRNQENDRQFELEHCWCVQQLQNALNTGKLSQKVADDTAKNLKILMGNTAPIIKKRQVMKASMGDYRSKMKEEEKKMALVAKQIKFNSTSADAGKSSSFVKKSALLSTGKEFKFNFNSSAADKQTNDDKNATDEKTQKVSTVASSDNNPTDNCYTRTINITSGTDFMFNFAIDEVNDEINFNELTIKN